MHIHLDITLQVFFSLQLIEPTDMESKDTEG